MILPDWVDADAGVASGDVQWDRSALAGEIEARAAALANVVAAGQSVGLLCDNGPEWIAFDLAAHAAGVAAVPLPGFFSTRQTGHAIAAAGVGALVCASAVRANDLGFDVECASFGRLSVYTAHASRVRAVDLPEDAQKVTYTSGTTAEPRGVWLSMDAQARTAHALASALRPLGITRHLCALPLPVLLENVAGVYTALTLGATCICPSLAEAGLIGASGFDASRLLDAFARYRPHSVIVLPQMLRALVAALPPGPPYDARVHSLKLVAVGGAKTPAALIAAARARGIPAYEGYGLTECASVVSLNVPGADRPGTAGRALSHVRVREGLGAEIEIQADAGVGYLGAPPPAADAWLRTGDLGGNDAEGYVSITGRSRNVLVTSFGRNVSPEWPEALLTESGPIAQAVVFGEARPWLSAVVVPSSPQTGDDDIDATVERVNAGLPDYARIRHWIRARAPFSVSNSLATANGRPRREAIQAAYREALAIPYITGNP